jgi:hypothetical protein
MAKAFRFTHAVQLPPELASLGFARLYKGYIDGKKQDQRRFFRKDLVVIHNLDNGRKVVRLVVGAGSRVSIPKDGVGLDYDAGDELQIGREGVANLEVRPATLMDKLVWLWNHPDRAERLMLRFGVAMGVLSLPDLVSIVRWFL